MDISLFISSLSNSELDEFRDYFLGTSVDIPNRLSILDFVRRYNMSARLYYGLMSYTGVIYIDELTRREFLSIGNMGKTSLRELIGILDNTGINHQLCEDKLMDM